MSSRLQSVDRGDAPVGEGSAEQTQSQSESVCVDMFEHTHTHTHTHTQTHTHTHTNTHTHTQACVGICCASPPLSAAFVLHGKRRVRQDGYDFDSSEVDGLREQISILAAVSLEDARGEERGKEVKRWVGGAEQ